MTALRRRLAILAPLLLLSVEVLGAHAATAAERTDLILLTVDTLRADALGAYGYEHDVSPRLDALAETGVLFEDAQTVIGKTGPAFASLFSSLYPPTHGARRNGVAMRDDVPVLAEQLQAAGYETAAFISNWTLRTRLAAVHRGFDHYDETFDQKRNAFGAVERTAESITSAALSWAEGQSAETDGKRPLFLWIHFSEPHTPYVLHEEVAPPAPAPGNRRSGWEKRRRYASEVAQADAWIGRLLDRLERHVDLENALLVFLSDHGESLGEHGYWGHGKNAHWANLRIPLFFRGKGVPRGVRLRSPASIVDVTPTILDLLGLEVPKGMEGSSLRNAWSSAGFDDGRARYAFADRGVAITGRGKKNYRNPLEISLERGGAKAVFSFERRKLRYYDLSSDPAEEQPLDAPPVETRPPLGRVLANWYRDLEKYEAATGVLSDEDMQQLKSLGYVGGGH